MKYLKYVAKATTAAAIAGVGGVAVGYADDSLTRGELWAAIAAAVVAGGGVFGVRNGDRP
ncbi:hypothetical protein ASE01_20150 [Nocardioides sp. Root190]|uniref:hypothetical protein n=1 Tax=Nocardioides sp. Root190 TaxID=1736488 RepID=UPI0006FCB08F|nr:hypothetical protein [Nocardioides sp. Root190]KRB73090.1 hypothetical protein ASE01_20150 [Nocardioides sp. Root190]